MSDVKIIVSKMPNHPDECPFSKLDLDFDYDYICSLDCNFNLCPLVHDKPCEYLITLFEKGAKNEEDIHNIMLFNDVR